MEVQEGLLRPSTAHQPSLYTPWTAVTSQLGSHGKLFVDLPIPPSHSIATSSVADYLHGTKFVGDA